MTGIAIASAITFGLDLLSKILGIFSIFKQGTTQEKSVAMGEVTDIVVNGMIGISTGGQKEEWQDSVRILPKVKDIMDILVHLAEEAGATGEKKQQYVSRLGADVISGWVELSKGEQLVTAIAVQPSLQRLTDQLAAIKYPKIETLKPSE